MARNSSPTPATSCPPWPSLSTTMARWSPPAVAIATCRVWKADGGRDLFTLKGHDGLVHGVAFSPDGQRLASASWDHTVKVWDTTTGKELLTFKCHKDRVQSVAFSPDGTRIASVGEDKTLRIWDAATGTETQPPSNHYGVLYSVTFNHDGRRVAVASWSASGWIKTWKVD